MRTCEEDMGGGYGHARARGRIMMVYCHDHSGKKMPRIQMGMKMLRMTEMAKAMFTRTSMDESPRLGYTPGYSHRL